MNERWYKKLGVFLGFTKELGELSTCKRAKVGCVIVPYDFSQIYSIGFNGPASKRDNSACLDQPQNCTCAHAESNAVVKLGDVRRAMLICTYSPCVACANAIINSGKIASLLYVSEYSDQRGISYLTETGIHVVKMTSDIPSSFSDSSGFSF